MAAAAHAGRCHDASQPTRHRSRCPSRAVGCCLATLLAWWVPGWRSLAFIGGLACLAYTGSWSLIIESPLWLLLKARKVRKGRVGC